MEQGGIAFSASAQVARFTSKGPAQEGLTPWKHISSGLHPAASHWNLIAQTGSGREMSRILITCHVPPGRDIPKSYHRNDCYFVRLVYLVLLVHFVHFVS
jgi:hypothetical protein